MPTLYTLTAAQALANLRTDLSDTNSSAYRWQDSDLNRAIDKANERYSQANPYLQSLQTPTVPLANLYPFPAGASYIDKVEYPVGYWPKSLRQFIERRSPLIAAPNYVTGAGYPLGVPAVTFSPGGHLSAGNYLYAFTFTTPGGGETTPSATFGPFAAQVNQQATIANILLGNYGVTGVNLYRTAAGGAALLFVAAIPMNPANYGGGYQEGIPGGALWATTSYTDPLADASLGAAPPIANSTANFDIFEIQIPPELWPPDNTQLIEITYATKHELDTFGTSIPERHWDTLYLGAVAFAMRAYLPQVNDNFLYEDGHLRDKVDDTKSTIAWQSQCLQAMSDFESKLTLVKEEANASIASMAYWGDKPIRWERL